MKYILTAFIVCLITMFSCGVSKEKTLVSLANLPSKQYTVNVSRDTVIQTENGALLKIPKGALKPESGNSVTLEIKEAYSLSQMIRAGLVTQADGKPLSSGGMIHIDAPRQRVSFTQPIRVAIPADFLQGGMQLYKGEEKNGKIDWVNPAPMPENKQIASIDTGQILFQANCASCHAIGKDLTGPNLAHFIKRFSPYRLGSEGAWMYEHATFPCYEDKLAKYFLDHMNDPHYEFIGDFSFYNEACAYKCNLVHMYGSSGPALRSDSTQIDLQAIFKYIQNESDRLNLPMPAHAYLKDCIDSCVVYKNETTRLKYEKARAISKKEKLKDENGPMVNVNPDTTWLRNNSRTTGTEPLPLVDYDKKVSPNNYDAVYYQFSVESFGWLNVDMMLDQVKGVEESELFVKITGDYKKKVNTFLILPSVKTYAEGGPADRNPDEFAYYLKNGKIPLPQNVDAYILAVSESENGPAFGMKKFTTGKKQEIEISLHTASKDEFTEAMKQFDVARLHIKVDDTKNATEIRKADTTIRKIDEQIKDAEKLKPKNCDCDCSNAPAAAVIDTVKKNSIFPGPVAVTKPKGDFLSITTFPNPSSNVFTIKINSSNPKNKISIRVMDIGGKLIEFKDDLAADQTIAVGASYKPGTYVLQAMQGQEQKTVKLIKQ